MIAPQGRQAMIDDPVAPDVLPLKRKSISPHWEFMFTRMRRVHALVESHRARGKVMLGGF